MTCNCTLPDDDTTDKKVKDKNLVKALAKINLSIKTNVIQHVQQAKDAKEAWDALKNAYEDSVLCRRLGLLQKMFSLKRNQFTSNHLLLALHPETFRTDPPCILLLMSMQNLVKYIKTSTNFYQNPLHASL